MIVMNTKKVYISPNVKSNGLRNVTLSTEKVEFENEATTTQCNVYQHQIGSHDRIVAATTLQSGLATAATHTTQKSFLQKIPQDEAKRIAKDEIETDIFAKDEIKTDVYDLTERSGRAVKVSSQVNFIFIFCFTFCMSLD